MILKVIVDISTSDIDRAFDYVGEDIPIGSRVSVEFGRRRTIGFVIDKSETTDVSTSKLKAATLLDTPVDSEQLSLMHFMRERYHLRYIDVLRLFIPSKLRDERDPEYKRKFLKLNPDYTADELKVLVGDRAKKQLEAIDGIGKSNGMFLSEAVLSFGVSAINGLRDKNAVVEELVHERNVPLNALSREYKNVTLTSDQQNALNVLTSGKGTYLLHGVTGSGKTEVYLRVIENALKAGKTAIMLVPEISLTPQMLGIFRGRFGDSVAIIHSGLNESERYDEWKRLYTGEARIAIGARSAVFVPLKNLGVIIVDEQHDTSYVSDSNPRYDTETVARFRAENAGATLILGSATPDVETFKKAVDGEYTLISMPRRISGRPLPEMEIVDMTAEYRLGNTGMFSKALKDGIAETLKRGEQAMLFLNRRGYASFVRCKACGYIAKCEDCDVSLTYHKEDNELKCHYCGKRYHMLSSCPVCHSKDIKQGRIGTEKVVEELQKLYPTARILRMDVDTTTRKDSYFNILSKFAKHEADILVGTQMIAKGHDFPSVTLVGILEADSALYFSDYRSSERTFQLVTQVSGRAGRADKEGKVILQTYAPRHYVFYFAKTYDYVGFWKKEINTRETTKFPPFTKIVRVLVSAKDEQDVVTCTKGIYQGIKAMQADGADFVYLGASRSPITRMDGLLRYQVLMRIPCDGFTEILSKIYDVADIHKAKNPRASVIVEINPQNLT